MKLVRVIIIIGAILIVSLASYFLYMKSVRDKEEARLKKYDKETQAIVDNVIKNLDSFNTILNENKYDEHILPPPNFDRNRDCRIKTYREYKIFLGITDVRSIIK